MTRIEITVGLLAIIGTVVVTAFVGLGEEERMQTMTRAYDVRSIENGAVLFEQLCADCHGTNASGGICPPLDETSGLHGGELGDGVAWRLEDLGWDRQAPYDYVYSVIASGRTNSTRPQRYPGNRTPDDPNAMAMPAWHEDYAGPLRSDEVRDLANYIVAFRDYLPDEDEENARERAIEITGGEVVATSGDTEDEVDLASLPLAEAGEQIFTNQTCIACHTLPGVSESTVGPTFEGLADTAAARVEADDYAGSAERAEAYIRESVREPTAHVVDGFGEGVMPAFSTDRLPEDELDLLIEYLLAETG